MTGNVYLDLTRVVLSRTCIVGQTLFGPPAALAVICALVGTHQPKQGATEVTLAPQALNRVKTLAAWKL